jgi:hypothetical protein
MKIYDVYYGRAGQELQTSLYVLDDGRKTWEDSPEWRSFYCGEDDKTAIADIIDRDPHIETFPMGLCIVQLRREPAK